MDAPVDRHHFVLRCIPGTDRRQQVTSIQQYIFPADFLSSSTDQWGNSLLYGSCFCAHTYFEANICGQVLTDSSAAPEEDSKDFIFRCPTPLTATNSDLIALCPSVNTTDDLLLSYKIMEAANSSIVYEPEVTNVSTSASQSLALGKGVCQDYAHIMIAMLRSKGIPSRYVTGMMLGEGKSHAWVEVLIGGNWIAFDPTHNALADDNYIKISHGRDAADCSINRGIFRGNAGQHTDISVIVKEI